MTPAPPAPPSKSVPVAGDDSVQIWRQQTDSTLVNTASGLCLSPGTLAYGSPSALHTCTGDSIQQWILPTPN
jgi:hypothetical protein